MEKIYRFLSNNCIPALKACIVYVVSVLLNLLSDTNVLNGEMSFGRSLINFTNSSVFIMWIFVFVVILMNILLIVIKPIVLRKQPSPEFMRMMKAHSDDVFITDVFSGVSWGQDKAVALPHSIVQGWKPSQIVIDDYDTIDYVFDASLESKHLDFMNSAKFKSVQRVGNDLKRYMLTKYKSNFDINNSLFVISLKSTIWNQTSFVWDYAKKNPEWKKSQVQHQLKSKSDFLPNSLCLHLIIETSDRKVLISIVSNSKSNDYPETKAVTIGEQVDGADFMMTNDLNEDFITPWVQRAIMEEFGLSSDMYEKLFDAGSIRVLGLTLEGDIINYAMPTLIRMKVTEDQFLEYVNSTFDQKEISSIDTVTLDEIPQILLNIDINNKEWHPSSYLRLLLYYLNRCGYERTCRNFVEADNAHRKLRKQ